MAIGVNVNGNSCLPLCISPVKLVMHASIFPGSTPQSPSGRKCPEPLFLGSILIRFLSHLHWLLLMWRNSDCIPHISKAEPVFLYFGHCSPFGVSSGTRLRWGGGWGWNDSVSANKQKSGPEPVCTQQHIFLYVEVQHELMVRQIQFIMNNIVLSLLSRSYMSMCSVQAWMHEAVSTSCTWGRVTSH